MNALEAQIIAGLVIQPKECESALIRLSESDFEDYGELFTIIKNIQKEKPGYDSAVVAGSLKSPALKQDLADCVNEFISIAAYDEYIGILLDNSQRRRINSKLSEILYDRMENPLFELQKIVEQEQSRSDVKSLKEQTKRQVDEFILSIEKPLDRSERVFTSWGKINNTSGGFRKGTISYVGARASTGKTAFAINVLYHQLRESKKCMMFSLEQSTSQIFEKMLSAMCDTNYKRMNDHNLRLDEIENLKASVKTIRDSEAITILDDVYTVEGMERTIAQMKPDFVIVDFIQIVRTMAKSMERKDQLDYVSHEFKRIAKKYNCHIMICSQINRAGRDKPTMSDLDGSGTLEQDGDYIIILHRPYVQDKANKQLNEQETFVNFDKNKYGPTGSFTMNFNVQYQKFEEVT